MRDFHSLLCLTSDNLNISHAEQIRIIIEEGARFIQIRSKKKSKNDLVKQINEVAEFVIKNKIMLIVNDFVDIAQKLKKNKKIKFLKKKKIGKQYFEMHRDLKKIVSLKLK